MSGIKGEQVPCGTAPLDYTANILKAMDGGRVCAVVPTSRNLRMLAGKQFRTIEIFSIKDFTSFANSYAGINIPKELRPYYLKKACERLSSDDKLTIFKTENSIFFESLTSFIAASSGILAFYRELAAEMIPTSALAKAGKYTDHEAQLAVLERLWTTYLEIIGEAGRTDEWECYKSPEYRSAFIGRYDKFVFLIGGYLTKYELEQLKNLAQTKDVTLVFTFTGEKRKHHTMYEEYLGITLSDIPEKEMSGANCEITGCPGMFAQYEAITYKALSLNARHGIDFKRMAVVIPDESVKTYFLRFDEYQLYDITSNEDIAAFGFFQILMQLLEIRTNLRTTFPPRAKLEDVRAVFAAPLVKEKFEIADALETIREKLESGKIFIGISELIKLPFFDGAAKNILTADEKIDFTAVCSLFQSYFFDMLLYAPETEHLLIKTIISEAEKLALTFKDVEGTTFTEAADIVTQSLSALKMDTPKRKIAVTGILESRNLDFDVVFIPEMNEGVFPPSNKKDLFLNTEIRNELGLPTFIDRENLLKNYLMQIISRSKMAFITYSKGDENKRRSRMIEELCIRYGLKETKYMSPKPSLITDKKRFFTKNDKIIIEKNDNIKNFISKFTLSASSFGTYVSCPLKFYFNYIVGTDDEPEAETNLSARTVGIAFHNSIEKLFKQNITPNDKNYETLFAQFMHEEFANSDAYMFNKVEKFRAEEIIACIPAIAKYERERIAEGYKTAESEKVLTATMHGFRVKGRIDRIDTFGGEYDLIDYKFKRLEDARKKINFATVLGDALQLPFYAAVFERIKGKRPANLYYFDLQETFKLKHAFYMDNYDEFLAFMEYKLTELASDAPFVQAETARSCVYCPYTDICGR